MNLFQLRKELNVTSNSIESDSSEPVNPIFDTNKVLTENEKYIVKKLNPDLSQLPINKGGVSNDNSFGLIDTHIQKALFSDVDNLYIWDYNSKIRDVKFNKIPLHDENTVMSSAPFCLFTWPVAIDNVNHGVTDVNTNTNISIDITSNLDIENGICIINKKNGQFLYYEDISSINNLYSKLSLSKAHSIGLKLKDNEIVTNAINCEPAGIVIATSLGRLLFISIRNSTGIINVELKKQLIKPQVGFLFSNFNRSKEIVSLKKGPIIGKGEILIYVTTKGGDLQIWQLSLTSTSFKRIDLNIHEQVLESLQDLYPFAHGTLQILDSHPLFSDSSSNFLVLSSISDGDNTYYILSTIIVSESTNSFCIFSTYRISTYFSSYSMETKPKLFVPTALSNTIKSTTSVFVLFKDAVVLSKVSSNMDSNYILKKKWEDVICFNTDIQIIGSGYNSDSLFIMSKADDIIQITVNDTDNENENDNISISFIKSHIDQSIYFSTESSNPIEFNLPKGIDMEKIEIENDLIVASNEIFNSKGKYIPPMLNTLDQHLQLRISFYRNLLNFVKENFNFKISPSIKLKILEKFEIMNSSLELLKFIAESNDSANIWNRVMTSFDPSLTLEKLILNELSIFPKLFAKFLNEISTSSINSGLLESKSRIINFLIFSLYDAVLEDGEKGIRFGSFQLDPIEFGENISWFITGDIFTSINQLFFDYKFSLMHINETTNKQLLTLIKMLYYISSHGLLWHKSQSNIDLKEYNKILSVYEDNHRNWIQVLCEYRLHDDALQITEFYSDLESLVETLEDLDFETSKELYSQYFEKFGIQFSTTLFKHYIEHNELKSLFFKFPEQHNLLKQFLYSSPDNFKVAWIQEIFDENYSEASKLLRSVSVDTSSEDISIDKSRIFLNIAKLAELVEPTNINENNVIMIQSKLDTINSQNNLYLKLENQLPAISEIYENGEFHKVFQSLMKNLKEKQYISINEIIDIYTLIGSVEDFVASVKLLSSLNYGIDYETKKILYTTIWRRCILTDKNWVELSDLSNSTLYKVLSQCMNEISNPYELKLPDYNDIISSVVSMDYISFVYGKHPVSLISIQDALGKEVHSIEQLGLNIIEKIKTIIGSANAASGNRFTINYETNSIE